MKEAQKLASEILSNPKNKLKLISSFIEKCEDKNIVQFLELTKAYRPKALFNAISVYCEEIHRQTIGDIINGYSPRSLFECDNGEAYQFVGNNPNGEPMFLMLGSSNQVSLNLNDKCVRLF